MTKTIDAVFENGVLRPLERLGFPEGKQVRITLEQPEDGDPADLLDLALKVYEDLSPDDIDEIEKIAVDRNSFFTGRTS